jgi:hypothetical protein
LLSSPWFLIVSSSISDSLWSSSESGGINGTNSFSGSRGGSNRGRTKFENHIFSNRFWEEGTVEPVLEYNFGAVVAYSMFSDPITRPSIHIPTFSRLKAKKMITGTCFSQHEALVLLLSICLQLADIEQLSHYHTEMTCFRNINIIWVGP